MKTFIRRTYHLVKNSVLVASPKTPQSFLCQNGSPKSWVRTSMEVTMLERVIWLNHKQNKKIFIGENTDKNTEADAEIEKL